MTPDYRALAIAEASVGEWHSAALAAEMYLWGRVQSVVREWEAAIKADEPTADIYRRYDAELATHTKFYSRLLADGDQAAVEAWLVTVKGAA